MEVITAHSVAMDQEPVYESVKRRRAGRAYETAVVGYGAEIAARIADDCFAWLDAQVKRVDSTIIRGLRAKPRDAILPGGTFRKAYGRSLGIQDGLRTTSHVESDVNV